LQVRERLFYPKSEHFSQIAPHCSVLFMDIHEKSLTFAAPWAMMMK